MKLLLRKKFTDLLILMALQRLFLLSKLETSDSSLLKKHLKDLEEQAISIIRDTYSFSENPVVLYSIGKDSSDTSNNLRSRMVAIKNEEIN